MIPTLLRVRSSKNNFALRGMSYGREAIKQNGPHGHSNMPDKGRKEGFYETR